tara:strand:+ start:25 stop:423 length:399 start_codon:yes stop_codon:yes gene_type:complete
MAKFTIQTSSLTENAPLEWISYYDSVKVVGESFSFTAEKLLFNEDNNVIRCINESEAQGVSIYTAHHPEAKFKDSTPDGIRLINALGRFLEVTGDDIESDYLFKVASENCPMIITCTRTEKGRLWSCSPVTA